MSTPIVAIDGIPRLDERRELAAWDDAERARNKAIDDAVELAEAPIRERRDILAAKQSAERLDMAERHEREMAAINAEVRAAVDAAKQQHPSSVPMPRLRDVIYDPESGGLMRCSGTGLVLFKSDDIITDIETNEMFLRAAISMPKAAS